MLILLCLSITGCETTELQPGSLPYIKREQRREIFLACMKAFKEREWRTGVRQAWPRPQDRCMDLAEALVK